MSPYLYSTFTRIARPLALASLMSSTSAFAALVTFDDNSLATNSFFNPQANTQFVSGGVTFDHQWNDTFNCCWGNFTYSNSTDTSTAGFGNDRSAITGDGAGAGYDNYGVSYADGAYIQFDAETVVLSAEFTNTTYSYLAMVDGNDGAGFVKGPFGEDDFFRLDINGLDSNGDIISTTSLLLADGANVISDWTLVDLSVLGSVYGLSFGYDSSDIGQFGVNTPTYFAIDNIHTVPVPASAWLLASALLGLAMKRKLK